MTTLAWEIERITVMLWLWDWLCSRLPCRLRRKSGELPQNEAQPALPKPRPRPHPADAEQVALWRQEIAALRRLRRLQAGSRENRAALDQYLAEGGLIAPE